MPTSSARTLWRTSAHVSRPKRTSFAAAMRASRAASRTGSPIASGAPSAALPTNTWPVSTPTRSATSLASRSSAAARSARSASSSWTLATPNDPTMALSP